MIHHKGLENNWFLHKNFDKKLVHSTKIDLKYQKGISTQASSKTTSKYLSFETNLVSVAQFVSLQKIVV